MKEVIELVEFKLRNSADEKEFFKASESFYNEFLRMQQGLISRKLIKDGDTWGDLAIWDSMENARAIETAMQSSEIAGRYNSFINPNSVKMKHFDVIQ